MRTFIEYYPLEEVKAKALSHLADYAIAGGFDGEAQIRAMGELEAFLSQRAQGRQGTRISPAVMRAKILDINRRGEAHPTAAEEYLLAECLQATLDEYAEKKRPQETYVER